MKNFTRWNASRWSRIRSPKNTLPSDSRSLIPDRSRGHRDDIHYRAQDVVDHGGRPAEQQHAVHGGERAEQPPARRRNNIAIAQCRVVDECEVERIRVLWDRIE